MDSKNLIIDGITYISSSTAGDLAGYTHDYVARLCREGKIKGVQIARQWFVDEKAFHRYLDYKQREKERARHELIQERQREYAVAQRTSLLPASLDLFNKLAALAVALIVTVGPYTASHHPAFANLDDRARALASVQLPSLKAATGAIHAFDYEHAVETVRTIGYDVFALGTLTRQSIFSHVHAVAGHMHAIASTAVTDTRNVALASTVVAVQEILMSIIEPARSLPSTFNVVFADIDVTVATTLSNAATAVDARLEAQALGVLDAFASITDIARQAFAETIFSIQVRMLAVLDDDEAPTVAVVPDDTNEAKSSSDDAGDTTSEGEDETAPTTNASSASRSPVNEIITERVIQTERIIRETGLSTAEIERRLAVLEGKLTAQIFNLESQSGNNTTRIINNYNTISQTNKIDDLGSVTIHDSSITDTSIGGDSTFSGTSVSATTVTGSEGTFGSLTITGALIGQSTADFYGVLSTPNINATSTTATSTFSGGLVAENTADVYGLLSAPRFAATSTTATSTFAGGVDFGAGDFLYDPVTGITSVADLLATRATTTNATSTNLSVSNILSVTNGAATSTFAGGITIESSGFVYDYSTNRVGIGTDSPSQSLEVSGSGYFTGGLGIGIATSTAGVLETSGNAYIGGDLTVLGDSVTIGASTADSVTINSTINSNLIPDQNATRDIGSPAFYWDDGFFDTITANNLSAASSTISGTQSETFTLNTNNTTADTEDMDLIFFRGTVVPNALITWDSTLDRFDLNQPVFLQNDSSTTTRISLDVWGKAGQTADLLRVASSSGTSLFTVTSSGDVGIGTTTPAARFAVGGAAYFDDSITAGDITATGTLSGAGLSSSGTFSASGLATFSSGFLSHASSTITSGGLTTVGYSTTTQALVVQGAGATSTFAGGLTIESSGFVYDYSTNRVGIGTDSPGQTLSVTGDADITGALTLGTALAVSEGGTGLTTFGGSNTVLYTSAAGTLASNANFVFDGTNLGVGTSTPAWKLAVAGIGSFDDYVRASYFTATSTAATSTFAGGLTVGTNGFVYDHQTGRVGIGTASPSNLFTVDGVSNFTGNVGIGTTSPYRRFSVEENSGALLAEFRQTAGGQAAGIEVANSASSYRLQVRGSGSFVIAETGNTDSFQAVPFEIESGANQNLYLDSTGNVGIGTTSPWKRLSVTETVADAQLSVAYDATRYANFQVDSTGDLIINPQGDDVRLNDDNLYVCAGGSCPAGTPAGNGNLIVESNVGVGTSTPSEQFSVANNLFVGGGGSPALGTATSTYEGDIIIHGKLDVGTIDPVYTIGGVKYATYGHSTVGIKEETIVTITISEQNPETGNYEYRIRFSDLARGSDLWLFYQVTDFGRDWRKLVISATPGFDGRVFYDKSAEKNELIIVADQPGEVSLRLAADRFDASKWPNLRPDQGGVYKGHIIPEKK